MPTRGGPAPAQPPSDYDSVPSVPSALPCPANTVYQSCMTPCPASCATLAAPRDCKGPCVEGCASLPGYIYSGAQSLPLAHCGCTNNGIYYQVRAGSGRPRESRQGEPDSGGEPEPHLPPLLPLQQGDGFVTEDCSQRCTCASSGVLLCEPLSCSPGEICTLGNLTRGCFRGEPGLALDSGLGVGVGVRVEVSLDRGASLPVLCLGLHLISVRKFVPCDPTLSSSGGAKAQALPSLSLCSLPGTMLGPLPSVSFPGSPLVLTHHLGVSTASPLYR